MEGASNRHVAKKSGKREAPLRHLNNENEIDFSEVIKDERVHNAQGFFQMNSFLSSSAHPQNDANSQNATTLPLFPDLPRIQKIQQPSSSISPLFPAIPTLSTNPINSANIGGQSLRNTIREMNYREQIKQESSTGPGLRERIKSIVNQQQPQHKQTFIKEKGTKRRRTPLQIAGQLYEQVSCDEQQRENEEKDGQESDDKKQIQQLLANIYEKEKKLEKIRKQQNSKKQAANNSNNFLFNTNNPLLNSATNFNSMAKPSSSLFPPLPNTKPSFEMPVKPAKLFPPTITLDREIIKNQQTKGLTPILGNLSNTQNQIQNKQGTQQSSKKTKQETTNATKRGMNMRDDIFTSFAYESKRLQLESKYGIGDKNFNLFPQGIQDLTNQNMQNKPIMARPSLFQPSKQPHIQPQSQQKPLFQNVHQHQLNFQPQLNSQPQFNSSLFQLSPFSPHVSYLPSPTVTNAQPFQQSFIKSNNYQNNGVNNCNNNTRTTLLNPQQQQQNSQSQQKQTQLMPWETARVPSIQGPPVPYSSHHLFLLLGHTLTEDIQKFTKIKRKQKTKQLLNREYNAYDPSTHLNTNLHSHTHQSKFQHLYQGQHQQIIIEAQQLSHQQQQQRIAQQIGLQYIIQSLSKQWQQSRMEHQCTMLESWSKQLELESGQNSKIKCCFDQLSQYVQLVVMRQEMQIEKLERRKQLTTEKLMALCSIYPKLSQHLCMQAQSSSITAQAQYDSSSSIPVSSSLWPAQYSAISELKQLQNRIKNITESSARPQSDPNSHHQTHNQHQLNSNPLTQLSSYPPYTTSSWTSNNIYNNPNQQHNTNTNTNTNIYGSVIENQISYAMHLLDTADILINKMDDRILTAYQAQFRQLR